MKTRTIGLTDALLQLFESQKCFRLKQTYTYAIVIVQMRRETVWKNRIMRCYQIWIFCRRLLWVGNVVPSLDIASRHQDNLMMTKLISNKTISKLCQNSRVGTFFGDHHLRKTSTAVETIDNINFSDHQTVFQYKSTTELMRNLSILRLN